MHGSRVERGRQSCIVAVILVASMKIDKTALVSAYWTQRTSLDGNGMLVLGLTRARLWWSEIMMVCLTLGQSYRELVARREHSGLETSEKAYARRDILQNP